MLSRLHVRWGDPPHLTSPTWGPPPSCKQASYCSCWFALDVTAAMLVIKNKSISLRWELNAIFMQILQDSIVLTTNMAALSHGWKPRIVSHSF